MLIRTYTLTKSPPVDGFRVSDTAYHTFKDGDKPETQYQLRIEDIIKRTGVCRIVMVRHRERHDGRDMPTWLKWTPATIGKRMTLKLRVLKKESHE